MSLMQSIASTLFAVVLEVIFYSLSQYFFLSFRYYFSVSLLLFSLYELFPFSQLSCLLFCAGFCQSVLFCFVLLLLKSILFCSMVLAINVAAFVVVTYIFMPWLLLLKVFLFFANFSPWIVIVLHVFCLLSCSRSFLLSGLQLVFFLWLC